MSTTYHHAARQVLHKIMSKHLLFESQVKRIHALQEQAPAQVCTGINTELDRIENHAEDLLLMVKNVRQELSEVPYKYG